MTEQQAQSPIDDLFRSTLENLPDTPSASGWDTPSDRVWQNVQANIQAPRKTVGMKTMVAAAFVVALVAFGLYWTMSKPNPAPASSPELAPTEQPAIMPSAPAESTVDQTIPVPKPASGGTKTKENGSKPTPQNSTEGNHSKPDLNGAQPLPGSKSVLPPNSTEAQKKKTEGN